MKEQVSLYFHYPFCEKKCPYCDFNSHVRDKVDNDSFLDAYLKEIDFYANYLNKHEIKTIYFGGGTPSLMSSKMVEAIINKISKNFSLKHDAEITIEANPASSEIEKFKGFKAAGINRISIGVQSFNNERLKFLGRKHNKDEAIKALEAAAEIFGDKYSFDLMYATKGQGLNEWQAELDFALKFKAKHLSLYQLTIEKGTEFYTQNKKGEIKTSADEVAEEMYFNTIERLKEHGLQRYEVSNFAAEGFESKHNLNYWNYGQYLGIGAGAHSRIQLEPNSNIRTAIYDIHNPEEWLNNVLSGKNFQQKKNKLSRQQMLEEMLYMGLRINSGIEISKFKEIVGTDFNELFDIQKLQPFIAENLLELTNTHLKTTETGIMLHTSICQKLIALAHEV